MTGRRSGKHSENAHPDDCANLETVRGKLHELLKPRLALGLTVTFISRSLGHRHEFMNQVREPFTTDTHGWLYDSFHDLCLGCVAVPRMKIYGLDGFTSPLWEMGKSDARYLGVGAQEVLKSYREAKGVSQRQMGEILDIHHAGVWRIENSDNPYMGTLQKYARAIGLIVKFDAVKWLDGDPGGYR